LFVQFPSGELCREHRVRRSKYGGRPCEGGPWPFRHRPRTTIRKERALIEREERIGSQRETEIGTSGEPVSRFEPLDVPPLLPFWLGCLIAAFIVAVLIGITIGFPLADRQQSRGPLQPLPPAPQLESAPAAELQRYDSAKRRQLESGKGATMSIEAAMRATAKQGWGPPK
jgi:hypothetical protein